MSPQVELHISVSLSSLCTQCSQVLHAFAFLVIRILEVLFIALTISPVPHRKGFGTRSVVLLLSYASLDGSLNNAKLFVGLLSTVMSKPDKYPYQRTNSLDFF